jgi:hypothetical protein
MVRFVAKVALSAEALLALSVMTNSDPMVSRHASRAIIMFFMA